MRASIPEAMEPWVSKAGLGDTNSVPRGHLLDLQQWHSTSLSLLGIHIWSQRCWVAAWSSFLPKARAGAGLAEGTWLPLPCPKLQLGWPGQVLSVLFAKKGGFLERHPDRLSGSWRRLWGGSVRG